MGQGYHSRSPEEFREYLKSLDIKKSKMKWRQIILFVQMLLLMFIIYLVYRGLNPEKFQDPSQSTKQVVDGHNAYLALSRENDDLFQGYFVFFENNSNVEVVLPKKDWTAEFRILTRDHVLCYSEPILWDRKKIPMMSKNFLYHSVSLKKLRLLEEHCRTEIFDETYSFFRSKFRYLNLSFYSNIIITTPTSRYVFQIKQKPYRWKDNP